MLYFIKQFIHRLKYKNYCRFGKNTNLDSSCHFEGANFISNNSAFLNSTLGYASYIGENSFVKNTIIGRYSSIAGGVKTVTGDHPVDFISSHPVFYATNNESGVSYVSENQYSDFKYIDSDKRISFVIGNDVWIGENVIIKEGITIGDGAIVAMGSIVVKDVPAYAIVGGSPAKIIRYRFDQADIERLNELRWWDKDVDWLQSHAHLFNDKRNIGKL